MRGADLVIGALRRAGVDTVFTLSGNQIMPLFDACVDSGPALIHVRHEAAAVYMADAWSQLTGRVGVALVTAAPGFANCLTPLYAARASESAVLLLSGDAPASADGRGAFQELDQVAVSTPLVKHAFRAADAAGLGRDVARAIRLAGSGRPGPVHLALPCDLLDADVDTPAEAAPGPFRGDDAAPDPATTDRILEHLAGASRPLVLTGPSLNPTRAQRELGHLEEALAAPVVTIESPRGLKGPELGILRRELPRSDLVLCLGKRVDFTMSFGDPPAFDGGCRFVVVDAEEDALKLAARNLGERLVLSVNAHPGAAAEALLDRAGPAPDARRAWRDAVRDAVASRFEEGADPVSAAGGIRPATLCRSVQRLLDASADAVLLADGGEFGQWAQACLSAPTRLINGPAGAIGGVLCYAVAAGICRPDSTVVALMGDGTAGFHLSEFDTAVRCGAAFIAVIGNDARWNAEYQIQRRDYGVDRLIGCDLLPTRYDLAVAGLGGHGEFVTQPDDLDGALRRAAASGKPACVNVRIEGLAAPAGAGH